MFGCISTHFEETQTALPTIEKEMKNSVFYLTDRTILHIGNVEI